MGRSIQRIVLFMLTGLLVAAHLGCMSIKEYISEADNIPTSVSSDNANKAAEVFDADNYFSMHGTILEKDEVQSSKQLHSEAEAIVYFTQRGFDQFPVIYSYSMDGKYLGEEEASSSSAAQHPIYETRFISKNECIWTITEIGGTITALPETYNAESTAGVLTILSESNELCSYDSITNMFYKTIPNKTEMRIIVTPDITSSALEEFSEKGFDER